jgi:glycosyltransferase involved in cell wall biosynthesis
MSHEDMRCFYKNFDCFLYPSLHDSGGLVVLEALSCGTPVVCLDIGGPGIIVNESCGAAIKVRNRDVDQLVGDLAFAVQEVIKRDTSVGCRMRASHFSWSNLSTKIILKHGMQTKI